MTMRVTLEIVPAGDEHLLRSIGMIEIFNRGPALKMPGWYRYGYRYVIGEHAGSGEDIFHCRDDGAVVLLHNVLDDMEDAKAILREGEDSTIRPV